MKKIIVSSVIIFLTGIYLCGQNLIGYGEEEVRQYMAENQKSMVFQTFTNNPTFKYLKYTDNDETVTLLFFLNEQSVCKSVRLVCDKSLKSEKTKEFNKLYKKTGDNQWTEIKNGKSYLIEIKEEEWSFNVTITLKE
jgi:hypothetical protein